jgi:hypothetical protein
MSGLVSAGLICDHQQALHWHTPVPAADIAWHLLLLLHLLVQGLLGTAPVEVVGIQDQRAVAMDSCMLAPAATQFELWTGPVTVVFETAPVEVVGLQDLLSVQLHACKRVNAPQLQQHLLLAAQLLHRWTRAVKSQTEAPGV